MDLTQTPTSPNGGTPANGKTSANGQTSANSGTSPESGISLPAFEPSWARQVRQDPRLLPDIAHAVGGPFHVLFPESFAQNLAEFDHVLNTAGVDGQVFFGKKANKAECWLPVCAESGAGVDVASAPELVRSLANGVRGEDVVVTGAAKSDELLWLAARHRCLLAVDALDELERVIALARSAGRIRILLRVLPELNPSSRFGFAPEELERAIERCAQEREHVTMDGFSFHLNGYDPAPRASLADELVDRCLAARQRGLPAGAISIGGGFAVSYLDADTWQRFHDQYRDAWFHGDKKFTHFYPYHQSPTGADMLADILGRPANGEFPDVGAKFARTGTRLLLEPGRALLDGGGFTAFPVQGFKQRADHGVVTVSGLSMSISEQWKGSEYLPDPLLWPENGGDDDPVSACVGGASCLDYDMLTWRKVPFPRAPRFGDLLVYPNTAGYQMDKNETEFHQQPLPSRIVVSRDENRFQWRLDRGL